MSESSFTSFDLFFCSQAIIRGELDVLKDWCYEAVSSFYLHTFKVLSFFIREGLTLTDVSVLVLYCLHWRRIASWPIPSSRPLLWGCNSNPRSWTLTTLMWVHKPHIKGCWQNYKTTWDLLPFNSWSHELCFCLSVSQLAMGKIMDQGPVLIITFQAQVVMVIRSPKGEVVEGDPVSSIERDARKIKTESYRQIQNSFKGLCLSLPKGYIKASTSITTKGLCNRRSFCIVFVSLCRRRSWGWCMFGRCVVTRRSWTLMLPGDCWTCLPPAPSRCSEEVSLK